MLYVLLLLGFQLVVAFCHVTLVTPSKGESNTSGVTQSTHRGANHYMEILYTFVGNPIILREMVEKFFGSKKILVRCSDK